MPDDVCLTTGQIVCRAELGGPGAHYPARMILLFPVVSRDVG